MEFIDSKTGEPIDDSKNSDGSKIGMILCCDCGTSIKPNPSNMCVQCLRNHVDITENIPKQAILQFCRNCERYLLPPGEWVAAALESRELLALCIKRLKGLKNLKLIDAGFIWTEPHSKRIKVKLTVHGEVFGGAILQQIFVVEYTVQNQMCDDCHRVEAKDYWKCLVQLRQRCENQKTIYYLEQLILKHKAHDKTLGIKPIHGGLDFFYANESHARKFVDFIETVAPVKVTTSKRLISHDIHSNNFNYKYTWFIEIAPVSKNSIICLSKKLRQQLGNLSAICLIDKVASNIHLIDPFTAQVAEISQKVYFRAPFEAICNPKQLVEYIVMDIDTVFDKDRRHYPGMCQVSMKHVLCDVWVVRANEIGIKNTNIHTRSHLGHLLKVGDSVLGYNLREANINNEEFDKLPTALIPDVLLVRKIYTDQQIRKNQRNWKLKHLAVELADKYDYNEFLEDLEEDPEYRKQVNIYRDAKKFQVDSGDTQGMGGDNMPHITLAEMLEDLTLDSPDDEMGGAHEIP